MASQLVLGTRKLGLLLVALSIALLCASTAHAQTPFTISGGGAGIPAVGTGGGGQWNYQTPPSPAVSYTTTPMPTDACIVTEVKILGLSHTWVGDLQILLVSPSGTRTNLVVRPGFAGSGNGNSGNCTGGDYSIVDADATGVGTVPTTGDWLPGTYAQSFGNWQTGSGSIFNTVLESLAAETGTWGLEIYDWAGGDIGSFASWEMRGIRGLPVTLSGPGGPIPATGTGDGTWPGTLPSSPLVSFCEYAPPGFLKIESVEVDGLTHSWCGDLQMVLYREDGVGIDLVHRPGFTGLSYGNGGDCTGGTYRIVEPGNPLGAAVPTASDWTAGTYQQSFGTWPTGTSSIHNLPLTRFHGSAGHWSLAIFDWAGGDSGGFIGWRLNGYFVPIGPLYFPNCSGGTTTNGCVAGMIASTMPSISNAYSCILQAVGVEGQKNGIVFYGVDGDVALPFGNSTLCVKSPVQRTLLQNSGGTAGACNGTFLLDWDAYRAANPFALGQPFHVGQTLTVQAWFRDPPAPGGTNLSSAILLTNLP